MERFEVVLARHGETEWSRTLRHTGRTDIPLTDAGRREAEGLRERLATREFERVLASPLGRAIDTARLAGLGERAEPRDELLEFDYGEYEGLTTAEIRETVPGWTVWTHGSKGGESCAEVGARLDRVVAELREATGDVARLRPRPRAAGAGRPLDRAAGPGGRAAGAGHRHAERAGLGAGDACDQALERVDRSSAKSACGCAAV